MNRLVIVGNGFDITMGCPTRVEDFLLWLFKKELQAMFKQSDFKSSIVKSTGENTVFSNRSLNDKICKCDNLASLLEIFKNEKINGATQFIKNLLLHGSEQKWFSLENIYFRELKNAIQLNYGISPSDNLKQLNDLMTFFSDELENYLSNIQEKHHYKLSREHRKFFNQLFLERKVTDVPTKRDVLFLNFNYTNVLENYLFRATEIENLKFIHIHGRIGNQNGNNPILVGYGNDLSDDFKEIEKFNQHELTMKFVKPFHYSRNSSFSDLMNFIELGEFEIYIVGHSCAMTDHTLFRHILDSNNCKRIKLFHKGGYEDFFKRNAQIGRHFIDKMKRVKLIMEYDENDFIPEVLSSP